MRSPTRTRAAATSAALLLVLAAAPPAARANGNNSHLWITLDARAHLPEGELRTLLSREELFLALANGTSFPDGGYVVGDDYGEMAHWEPFLVEYMAWIRAHHAKPYAADGDASAHVAFLMGIASHGLADQVYDSAFMAVARVHDGAGWSDETLDSFDTATDVMLVVATGQDLDPEAWVPSEELAQLFADAFGYPVDPGTLDSAQRFLRSVLLYPQQAAQDPAKVATFSAQYAWAAAHLMDAHVPGGPPCEGAVIAAYWQAVWDRLHGEASLENLVVGTMPSPGAAGQPTSAALVESQVMVVFGHAIDDDSLADGSVTVTDAAGTRHDVELAMWRRESNVLGIRPVADWPADTVLTVTLEPGLRTIDGLVLDAAWSFDFSTSPAGADDALPGAVDPTPNSGPPDTGAEPGTGGEDPDSGDGGDGGGCAVGGRGDTSGRHDGAAWSVLAAGLLGLTLARRARRPAARSTDAAASDVGQGVPATMITVHRHQGSSAGR